MATEPCLLVVDDTHNLASDDAAATLPAMIPEPGVSRVVLLTRDVLPLPKRDERRVDLRLDGLDEGAARELWAHLEETYGPTKADACDAALVRTRGMPLALRREYAAANDSAAWDLEKLEDATRAVLEAIAILRVPVAPAAVAGLVSVEGTEASLSDLLALQLVNAAPNGRFLVHDVVRDQVLGGMEPALRVGLEAAAADLVFSVGTGQEHKRRLAWDAGDDGALGLVDPVDRLREAILHLIAADKGEDALQRIVAESEATMARGAGGELLALIEILERDGVATTSQLAGIRARVAVCQGRVAQALELCAYEDELDQGLDPVDEAFMSYRAGSVREACETLYDLVISEEVDWRGRAGAMLAEAELERGETSRARTVATASFERDRTRLDGRSRARLHMALAECEIRAGDVGAARTALSRAKNSGHLDRAMIAAIDAKQAYCLAAEGRVSDAYSLLKNALIAAQDVDNVLVADEVRRIRSLVDARAGELSRAQSSLGRLVAEQRARGDEVGALRAEMNRASILVASGCLSEAAALATACINSARPRGLGRLVAEAELVLAEVELGEQRLEDATARLANIDSRDALIVCAAAGVHLRVQGWLGKDASATEGWPESRMLFPSEVDALWVEARARLARRDAKSALELSDKVAVAAERAGRLGELTEALALQSRLHMAQGDTAAATSTASRAAREARVRGLVRAQVHSLLTLAALSRDGEMSAASSYAQDAFNAAAQAGLPVERLVAAHALEIIAQGDVVGDIHVGDARNAAAATLSEHGVEAAARLLADLGFTAARPYRVVVANGRESFVADANPNTLRLTDRDLAVDAVREVVVRNGSQVADLRRRSLLKRLLFLFAGAPGRSFSKEDIVQTVWNVEYHPLRHDAALFTNIMRIRRLLGKDGAELIRVSDEGYRFDPPKDYLFVGPAGDA
jgi:hypothetical protein